MESFCLVGGNRNDRGKRDALERLLYQRRHAIQGKLRVPLPQAAGEADEHPDGHRRDEFHAREIDDCALASGNERRDEASLDLIDAGRIEPSLQPHLRDLVTDFCDFHSHGVFSDWQHVLQNSRLVLRECNDEQGEVIVARS